MILRILQVIQKPQNRGAETFACQLSSHLVNLGHEVKVIAVFEGEADLPFSGEIHTLHASPHKRFTDFKAWKRLAAVIENFKPDIVQANAGDTLKYIAFSKMIYGWDRPVIARNASEIGRYLKSYLHKKFTSMLYKQVDLVISVSEASQKDIVQHFPFLKDKTRVVPVGLERKENIEAKNLVPENRKHLVHIGGFSFEKNHKGLLRIFQRILEQDSEVHLHLVGDGPLRHEIESITGKSGYADRISFYGFVNNPLSYIKGADVLVLPSIIEGLPGVLLEAMYCKTAVVAYDVGGISEIVNPHTGSLIEKDKEVEFATAVIEQLRKPNAVQIKEAYSMVTNNFMNDQIALNFVNCYERTCSI